jgi:hypothetical protein
LDWVKDIPWRYQEIHTKDDQVWIGLRIFPGDIRKSTQKMTRFGLVLSAYSGIRECVLNNHTVMKDTEIQLPDINKGTLTQWYAIS